MIIYLLNNHEAVARDNGRNYVTVEPRHDGVLLVEGKAYPVKGDGSTMIPAFPKTHGAVTAAFTTEGGIVYRVITPYMTRGTMVSRVDPFEGYIMARRHICELEHKLEEVVQNFAKFKASIKHDSLGFIIGEDTKNEED